MNEGLFLDTNILMELLFQRSKFELCTEQISRFKEVFASSLSFHILMYYTEKEKLDYNNTFDLFQNLSILELNNEILELAKSIYKGKDFEDCLQFATSKAFGVPQILTMDKGFYKNFSDQSSIILL